MSRTPRIALTIYLVWCWCARLLRPLAWTVAFGLAAHMARDAVSDLRLERRKGSVQVCTDAQRCCYLVPRQARSSCPGVV